MRTDRKLRAQIATITILLLGGVCTFILPPFVGKHEQSFIALGVSFMTAGVIAFILDRTSFTALVGEVVDKLEIALQDMEVRKKGVVKVESAPFYNSVYEKLKSSKSFILVQTWSPDLINLLQEASSVVERGGEVRVYLLHPKSEFARQRGIDLGPGPEHVPGKIISDTRDIRSQFKQLQQLSAPGNLRLFYYNSLPSFAIYGTDDQFWVGSYWYGAQSDKKTTYVIERPSHIAANYEEHLKRLYQLSVEVPLDKEEEPPLSKIPVIGNYNV